MPTAKRVLAVCVNWNGREVLPAAVASLLESDYPNLDLVVADNDSSDGSLERLPTGVEVVRLAENRGYGGAINAVLQSRLQGEWEYFLLLNNDVIVPPETVSRLVEFAEVQGPGVFGPKILLEGDRNRLDAAWGSLAWHHVLARYRGRGARDGPRWNRVRRVQLLLGCALLVHRAVFERIGLFDENFFMYHEEVDFLYRAQRAGVPVYYCPFAQVFHRSAYSTRLQPEQKILWVRRNAVYFLRKHRAGPWRWMWFWASLGGSLLFNAARLDLSRARAILSGVREGLRMPVPA